MINEHYITNIESVAQQFRSGNPYPHVVLDNFIDHRLAEFVISEVKNNVTWYSSASPDSPDERFKYFSPLNTKESIDDLNRKCPITFSIMTLFKSQQFLDYLSYITGIDNLLADSGFTGSGLHKTCNGGKLNLHIDFSQNWNTNLHRRVNFLLYLNKEWKDEYNGHLELWNTSPWRCEQKIAPIFNRAVIFNTTRSTFHGHPAPLNCPQNVERHSIALYYYTKAINEGDSAQFRPLTFVR